jgi:hypothetical protein
MHNEQIYGGSLKQKNLERVPVLEKYTFLKNIFAMNFELLVAIKVVEQGPYTIGFFQVRSGLRSTQAPWSAGR